MVVKQRNNNCFINSKWHLYGYNGYCNVPCSFMAQTPLMVAGPGIEPRTEDYESSVIPFYYPAIKWSGKTDSHSRHTEGIL